MLAIIILYAFFATSFPITKKLLNYYTTPIFLAGSRLFLAGSLLLCYQYFYAYDQFKLKRKHIKYYAQIIVIGMYINYILRVWALKSIDASKAAFLFNLSPFAASIYSYFLFNEQLNKKQWLGLGLGCIGLIPILFSTSPLEQLVGEISFLSLPEIAIILSVACHTYSWIIMRKLVRDKSYSPIMVNGICMFVGGIMSLLTSIPIEGVFPIVKIGPFIGWLLLVVLISNIFCHNLYAYLLRYYSVTFLSFSGFLSPIFTAFYGWMFLAETITWHFYVSGGIIFAGLSLFYKDELNKTKNPYLKTPPI